MILGCALVFTLWHFGLLIPDDKQLAVLLRLRPSASAATIVLPATNFAAAPKSSLVAPASSSYGLVDTAPCGTAVAVPTWTSSAVVSNGAFNV